MPPPTPFFRDRIVPSLRIHLRSCTTAGPPRGRSHNPTTTDPKAAGGTAIRAMAARDGGSRATPEEVLGRRSCNERDRAPTSESVRYEMKTRRLFATTKKGEWYLGLHANRASGEEAAQGFLSAVRRRDASSSYIGKLAADVQSNARCSLIGQHGFGFEHWRDRPASAPLCRSDELYGTYKGVKTYLGSFRTEAVAREAHDAFLSLASAGRSFTEATVATKQLAVEEASISRSSVGSSLTEATAASKQLAAEETASVDEKNLQQSFRSHCTGT